MLYAKLLSARLLRYGVLLLTCMAGPLAASGQPTFSNQGPDRPVSKAERRALVGVLLDRLDALYVLPEVAARARQAMQAQLKRGGYDHLTSSRELAATLTAQLRELTHDQHLAVNYQSEPVPETTPEAAPTAAEQALARRYAERHNAGFVRVERLAGNVGYLRLDEFAPAAFGAAPADAAFAYLAHTDALILDLRHNHGGEPDMVAYLASYLFGADPVHLNDLLRRGSPQPPPTAYWTRAAVPGPRYGPAKPVYVLTSRRTFSAGEECAYDLQALRRATVVGETTAGGANPGEPVRLGAHFLAFIPTEQARNPVTHTNWEGTGVAPDVAVAEAEALPTAYRAALTQLAAQATAPDEKRELERALKQLAAPGVQSGQP